MKKIIIGLILIFLCITSNANASDILFTDVYSMFRDSTVSIFSVGNNEVSTCSGVLIENTLHKSKVLTAKHCIDVFEKTYVEDIEVSYIITSKDDDIALLVLNQYIPYKTSAKLFYRNVYKLEKIYHIGYPNLDEYKSEGYVNLARGDSHYAKMKIIPGCSGGGLFNEKGKLVGIVWGGVSLYSNKSLAIYEPLTDINRFLRTINEKNN